MTPKNRIKIEKATAIAGSFFLVFIITFSLYTVIRKNQQAQLQFIAQNFIEKSISSITKNWDYIETQSLFSNRLIQQTGKNNNHIFNNFSRLGKLISNEKPVFLNDNPAPESNSLSINASYKVMATFENGQAIFLFNVINEKDITVIDYINIDVVYNVNTA